MTNKHMIYYFFCEKLLNLLSISQGIFNKIEIEGRALGHIRCFPRKLRYCANEVPEIQDILLNME